jgi:hypothetical protein
MYKTKYCLFDLLYSRRVQVQQEKHWSKTGYCKESPLSLVIMLSQSPPCLILHSSQSPVTPFNTEIIQDPVNIQT